MGLIPVRWKLGKCKVRRGSPDSRNTAAMASICISASRRPNPSFAWILRTSDSRIQDGNDPGATASFFGCSPCIGMRLDILMAAPVVEFGLASARPPANRYIRLGDCKTGVCALTNTANGALVHLALWGDEQTAEPSQDIVSASCTFGLQAFAGPPLRRKMV